jgi:hypothetical protein
VVVRQAHQPYPSILEHFRNAWIGGSKDVILLGFHQGWTLIRRGFLRAGDGLLEIQKHQISARKFGTHSVHEGVDLVLWSPVRLGQGVAGYGDDERLRGWLRLEFARKGDED